MQILILKLYFPLRTGSFAMGTNIFLNSTIDKFRTSWRKESQTLQKSHFWNPLSPVLGVTVRYRFGGGTENMPAETEGD